MDESQNIEYKSIWKDEYYKWICGFANAIGGRIFLGVDDDPPHKPVQCRQTDGRPAEQSARCSGYYGRCEPSPRLLASLSDYLEVKGTTGKGTYYVVKGFTKGSFMDAMIVDTVVVAKRIDIKDFL